MNEYLDVFVVVLLFGVGSKGDSDEVVREVGRDL